MPCMHQRAFQKNHEPRYGKVRLKCQCCLQAIQPRKIELYEEVPFIFHGYQAWHKKKRTNNGKPN